MEEFTQILLKHDLIFKTSSSQPIPLNTHGVVGTEQTLGQSAVMCWSTYGYFQQSGLRDCMKQNHLQ